MRTLTRLEFRQRGCAYCADRIGYKLCKYNECRYRELDYCTSYEEWYQSLPEPGLRQLFLDIFTLDERR